MSKSILKRIVYPIVYTVLSLGIVIAACFTFSSVYFESVFVDGSSMEPTLKGTEGVEGGANFGFTDNSSVTKKHLKRFDIITTYYPFSSEDYDLPYVKGSKLKDTAYYKIKRVIALPGDTFKIENNELYFKNEGRWLAPVNFDSYGIKRLLGIDGDYKDVKETTLKDDEYWVMGDNWTFGGSKDSATMIGADKWNGPIYYENIIGKLIAIEGVCTIVTKNGKRECTNRVYFKNKIYFK